MGKIKIYVASSWKNDDYDDVIKHLRNAGLEVLDWRAQRSADGTSGFQWSDIDPDFNHWNLDAYKSALQRPVVIEAFKADFNLMVEADVLLCLLPCGKSAHMEVGWACGKGKPVYFLNPDPLILRPDQPFEAEDAPSPPSFTPELMYLLAGDSSRIYDDIDLLTFRILNDAPTPPDAWVDAVLRFDPFSDDIEEKKVTMLRNYVWPTARKGSKCSYCDGEIQRGEWSRAMTRTTVDGIASYRWCKKCCNDMVSGAF